MQSEMAFEREVVAEIRKRLPGSYVFKLDPHTTYQGIPDRIVLFRERFAMLEFKRSEGAAKQPNQQFYIDLFGEMSFAAFIYPENMEEVLDALCKSLGV